MWSDPEPEWGRESPVSLLFGWGLGTLCCGRALCCGCAGPGAPPAVGSVLPLLPFLMQNLEPERWACSVLGWETGSGGELGPRFEDSHRFPHPCLLPSPAVKWCFGFSPGLLVAFQEPSGALDLLCAVCVESLLRLSAVCPTTQGSLTVESSEDD